MYYLPAAILLLSVGSVFGDTPPSEGLSLPQTENNGNGKKIGAKAEEAVSLIIDAHIKAIQCEDFSKAYYAYTSADFQQRTPFEACFAFMRHSGLFAPTHSYEIRNITFSGPVASVVAYIANVHNQTIAVNYDLVEELGSWKIRSIRL